MPQPLERNLSKLHGWDLARQNPLIYTVRGVETVDEWADQVLADKKTSAIEGHIGTFLEPISASCSSRAFCCGFRRLHRRRVAGIAD